MIPAKTLYICYFGLREPLVQTQVLPYLREVMKDGVEVSIVTFEPEAVTSEDEKILRENLAGQGIRWHWLRYHKRPSAIATAYDIFIGSLFVWRLLGREKFDILHGRVHIPTLMGALARKFSRQRPKLLFDIRGFFPEEYTDAGIWPAGGWLYRSAKRVEKWLLREADGFVILTERGREVLFPGSANTGHDAIGRPVEVIPCCVDVKRFAGLTSASRTVMRTRLGVKGRRVMVYVGSFGGWYLSDEMFDLFAAARKADSAVFVMILTQRQTELATQRMIELGFAPNDFLVQTVSPAEMPAFLDAADEAVSFIKNCYSKQASSPTKNAEYLAAGLPIIANAGVGDVDSLIEGDGVGVLIDTFDDESYLAALGVLADLGEISDHCRETAKSRFDLEDVGGVRYRRLYERLLQSGL